VTGELKNPAGETVERVSGEWNASLDFTSVHVRRRLYVFDVSLMMLLSLFIYTEDL